MPSTLTDDAYGKIHTVALSIPWYAYEAFPETIKTVIAALPSKAHLEILADDSCIASLREWGAGRPGSVNIQKAPEDFTFTHWARDAQFSAVRNNRHISFISNLFNRHDDRKVAVKLAQAADLEIETTSCPVDGGNILVAGDQILVGDELLEPDANWLACDPQYRIARLGARDVRPAEEIVSSEILGPDWREHRRVGSKSSTQPQYHLDLYVAPAGKDADGKPMWLVGCPRAGAELLGLDLLDLADATLFDQAAKRLLDQGCTVIRNPMPLFWSDQEQQRLRTWFHLPVNNVLVEICRGTGKKVWLPCFGEGVWPELSAIDEANARIWRDLDFEVFKIPGFLKLAERRGALRCMCNVLKREKY